MAHSASRAREHRPVDVVVEPSFEHQLIRATGYGAPVEPGSASPRDGHGQRSRRRIGVRLRARPAAPSAAARGSGRPSFLAKYVSITCLAIGAPRIAVLVVLAEDHAGDLGLSFGAKNTNQPWSRRSRSACRAPPAGPGSRSPAPCRSCRRRRGRECARGRRCPRVDHHPQPVVQRRQRLGPERHAVGHRRRLAPSASRSPSSTALTTCGVTRVPPLATVEIITASDAGVTDTCPWPIDTEIVSPGYQRLAGALPLPLGVRDDALLLVRQVDAGLAGHPELLGPLVDLVHAEHVAERVEVDVARLLDARAACPPCRGRP